MILFSSLSNVFMCFVRSFLISVIVSRIWMWFISLIFSFFCFCGGVVIVKMSDMNNE